MAHKATARYLKSYIQPDLPTPPEGYRPWKHVLVVPVYNESSQFLKSLTRFLGSQERTLVILILNAPESTAPSTINCMFLSQALENATVLNDNECILSTSTSNIYIYNLENTDIKIPDHQGVGLARKIGCDLALMWHNLEMIESRWIANTDADATLPGDYFERLNPLGSKYGAATFPFQHVRNTNIEVSEATQLYELSMHYYVSGLEYANSPYAHHTIGSCMAITMQAYAEVGGIPKRSGGEDFHVLNKISKTGAIKKLTGESIKIESRESDRVPFGTGPAIHSILSDTDKKTLFYHPHCFEAVKQLLAVIPKLYADNQITLAMALNNKGLDSALYETVVNEMNNAGINEALDHCRKQATTAEQFYKQFTHWFDGLKTLQLIHSIRDSGWPMLTLSEMSQQKHQLFPLVTANLTPEKINAQLRKRWNWE